MAETDNTTKFIVAGQRSTTVSLASISLPLKLILGIEREFIAIRLIVSIHSISFFLKFE